MLARGGKMFFRSRKNKPTVAHLYTKEGRAKSLENFALTEEQSEQPNREPQEQPKPQVCRTTAYKIYAEKSREAQSK